MNDRALDELLKRDPFAACQQEKESLLVPVLRDAFNASVAGCPPFARLAKRQGWQLEQYDRLADLPFLPVSMFKEFKLASVASSQIVRELNSSSTTGQTPSRIFLDKVTSFRQAKALSVVLKSFLGGTRRPFLVLDVVSSAHPGSDALTARGAAIRGIANFASETTYAMRSNDDGSIALDIDTITEFFDRHGSEEILVFGFTFMVWKHVVLELEQLNRRFTAPGMRLLHSGGWKKLTSEAVTKETFNERTSAVFGCQPSSILDFYGMVEQVGTVFVDCEAGNKHSALFSDVVIRDPLTLDPVAPGEEGLIEVISALPASYPGHALMTEDKGRLIGYDNCPCGRKGISFRFTSRVERTEVRGCGDTYAAKSKL